MRFFKNQNTEKKSPLLFFSLQHHYSSSAGYMSGSTEPIIFGLLLLLLCNYFRYDQICINLWYQYFTFKISQNVTIPLIWNFSSLVWCNSGWSACWHTYGTIKCSWKYRWVLSAPHLCVLRFKAGAQEWGHGGVLPYFSVSLLFFVH